MLTAPTLREDLTMAILCSGRGVTVPGVKRSNAETWTQLCDLNLPAAVHTLPKIHVKAAPTAIKPAVKNPLRRNSRLLMSIQFVLFLPGKRPDFADHRPNRFRWNLSGISLH